MSGDAAVRTEAVPQPVGVRSRLTGLSDHVFGFAATLLAARLVLPAGATGASAGAAISDRAATKCFCTEHEQRVTDFAFRVLSPEATLFDAEVTKGLLYAPGYTIMGGTSNVMRNIIGERVLGLPREPRV